MIACHAIIPARYASQRLEGKPLALIGGLPMFWHVYTRAKQAKGLRSVTLATDDTRIAEAAYALDVPCLMTRTDHVSGTDRVHEAACLLGFGVHDVVVNIQGDEPLLEPAMLDELIAPFSDGAVQVSTLYMSISAEEALSPNRVKLVTDVRDNALYFSRLPIPCVRDAHEGVSYKGHIGLYAFRMEALSRFVSLPQGDLEKFEKLEQLRFLENGILVRAVPTKYTSLGVDTIYDLEQVRNLIAEKKA